MKKTKGGILVSDWDDSEKEKDKKKPNKPTELLLVNPGKEIKTKGEPGEAVLKLSKDIFIPIAKSQMKATLESAPGIIWKINDKVTLNGLGKAVHCHPVFDQSIGMVSKIIDNGSAVEVDMTPVATKAIEYINDFNSKPNSAPYWNTGAGDLVVNSAGDNNPDGKSEQVLYDDDKFYMENEYTKIDGGIFATPALPPGDPKHASVFDLATSPFTTGDEDKELKRLRKIIGEREKVISDLYKQMQETGDYGKIQHLKQKIDQLENSLTIEKAAKIKNTEIFGEKLNEMQQQLTEFKGKVENMEKNFKKNKINTETGRVEIELGGGTRKLNIGEDDE